MSTTTIKDLAKELNLSIATVSRALRDSHEISNETKEKVVALAKKRNYVLNSYASSLRVQKSRTIAVVLPEVTDSFFSLAINGIESVANDKGYHVLIYLTHESFEREEAILNEFKSGRVDGILISVSKETISGNHIKEAASSGIPIVFFDRVCDDVATAKVITDDFESSYKAVQHLVEMGCIKIAYLSISPNMSISKNRMEGYMSGLENCGIKTAESDIVLCGNSFDENYAIIKKMLSKKERPDGIIVSVEKLTAPVYLACKDLNLSIPDNVKLVSFTNLQTALLLDPPLSTITQPAFEMGKTAATILFKGIEKKDFNLASEKIVIPSELVERLSSGSH
jgi:LacI family transcriptional regulator